MTPFGKLNQRTINGLEWIARQAMLALCHQNDARVDRGAVLRGLRIVRMLQGLNQSTEQPMRRDTKHHPKSREPFQSQYWLN